MKILQWIKAWLIRLRPREGLHYIGGSDTLPPPLEREREAELLTRLEDFDTRLRRR